MISKASIQYVKSLQDKKIRQKYGHFVVEGEKSITELLKSQYHVKTVYALDPLINTLSKNHSETQFEVVTEKELKQISAHMAPQKALAVVEIPEPQVVDEKQSLILALDEIQDPGNLGTIIRIADWYGIRHLICSKGCTDVYNPKCINSTMGSFLRVNVVYGDILQISQKLQMPLMTAVLNGLNVHNAPLPKRGILVIGNEGHGISEDLIRHSEFKLTIPRFGGAESLNAAVSTAILLDNLIR